MLTILRHSPHRTSWTSCTPLAAPSQRQLAGRASCSMATPHQANAASIVWYRGHDLRVHDHQPLLAGLHLAPTACVPLFCLDDALLRPSSAVPAGLRLPGTGPHRLRALLQAVQGLRAALEQRGSDVLCVSGDTPAVLRQLVAAMAAGVPRGGHLHLCFFEGLGPEAVALEDAVIGAVEAAALEHSLQAQVHRHWGHALYHPADMAGVELKSADRINNQGHMLGALPATMTEFRSVVQRSTNVRHPAQPPNALPPLPPCLHGISLGRGSLDLDHTSLESLYQAAGAAPALASLQRFVGPAASAAWRVTDAAAVSHQPHPSSQQPFMVNEQAGLQRLHHLLDAPSGEFASLDASASAHQSTVEEEPATAAATHASRSETSVPREACIPKEISIRSSSALAADPSAVLDSEKPSSPMHTYQASRMMAGGVDSSAKLAAFLSLGCLSPRVVYWETLAAMLAQHAQHEEGQLAAELQQWRWQEPGRSSPGHLYLLMHLGIRDFFLYSALRDGDALYAAGGPQGRAVEWRQDEEAFSRWAAGNTGLPYVDASMRELAASGYTSNRGRQNVASFLTKGLQLDWRLGAELFQALLLCHDAALNFGNWAYVAGVGADPRDRIFRTVTQGERYDTPEANLISTWVPQLAGLPAALRHRPWSADAQALTAAALQLTTHCHGGRAEGAEVQQERLGEARAQGGLSQESSLLVERGGSSYESKEGALLVGLSYPLPMIDPGTQIGKPPRKKGRPKSSTPGDS